MSSRCSLPLAPALSAAMVVAAMAAAMAVAAPAAAVPSATLPDIEDEVMCPVCGTLLELSAAPQAERQRALVRRLIAAGRTKEEIKEALVAEYGEEVLAVPGASGFGLSAYLAPVVAFLAVSAALAVGVRRWRRDGGRPGQQGERHEVDPAAAERLDADLARYDL